MAAVGPPPRNISSPDCGDWDAQFTVNPKTAKPIPAGHLQSVRAALRALNIPNVDVDHIKLAVPITRLQHLRTKEHVYIEQSTVSVLIADGSTRYADVLAAYAVPLPSADARTTLQRYRCVFIPKWWAPARRVFHSHLRFLDVVSAAPMNAPRARARDGAAAPRFFDAQVWACIQEPVMRVHYCDRECTYRFCADPNNVLDCEHPRHAMDRCCIQTVCRTHNRSQCSDPNCTHSTTQTDYHLPSNDRWVIHTRRTGYYHE